MEPKFIPIYLTVEAAQLVIAALRKLPHESVHDLVVDIAAQVNNAQEAAKETEPTEVEVVEAN